MPKFSILVAVYNAEAWLTQCLDSLLRQTEQSLEVLCIDDCSTDGSLALLESYQQKDERIHVLQTPENSGQAVARNLGLAQATGELTMMVDADDWLAPDCLEKIWKSYQQAEDIDAVVYQLMLHEEDGSEHLFSNNEGIPEILDGPTACKFSIDWRLHGISAVRTSLHQQFPFDTTCRLYSDDNTCRIHYLHSRKVALSDGVYYYRQHAAGSTSQITRRRFDFLLSNDHLRTLLEEEQVDAESLQVCEDYIWKNYVGVWRQWQQNKQRFSPEEKEEIKNLLHSCFAHLRFSRLSPSVKRRPCYWPIKPYHLFALWQQLLLLRK